MFEFSYAYLFGLYLGDGWITKHPKRVYQLHVLLDRAYPRIVAECRASMGLVMPTSRTAVAPRSNERADEVRAYSKHWPCLFPQHGPGKKHERPIELTDWQRQIVDRYPWRFLRGLIHSDGCRFLNRIKHPSKTYVYPRYNFTNRSADIRELFCEYCDRVGVEWRRMTAGTSRSPGASRWR